MLIAFAIYVTPLRTIKGVSNTYSYNTITDSPHNCFLGGGNEADANSTVAGIDCVFDGNTLDRCAYEAADAGAFYTCGQEGAAKEHSYKHCCSLKYLGLQCHLSLRFTI